MNLNPGFSIPDSSTIAIFGSDFAVNGVPASFGDLPSGHGELTGALASGEMLSTDYCQGGSLCTGTITLVPEPSTALLLAFGLLGLAAEGRRKGVKTTAKDTYQ